MKTYIPKNTEFFFVPASEFLADDGTWMSERLAEEVTTPKPEEGEDSTEYDEEAKAEAERLEGWYWWSCFPGCLPEGDATGPFETEEDAQVDAGEEVEDEVYALCMELDVEPLEMTWEEHRDYYGLRIYSVGRKEYAVGTDEEADQAWDQALDSYLDDCGMLDDIPENLRRYFDRDAWKRDARHNGRGHALSPYDGDEIELDGDLYAFRIN